MEDVSLSESFDLLCCRLGDELHVEVKGSTGPADQVTLTRNEVRHAQSEAKTALVVVGLIDLSYTSSGIPSASGGVARVLDPWLIDEADLTPTQYQYSVPSSAQVVGDEVLPG